VRALIAKFREQGVPVVWIQEVHKPSMIDIGRELDGAEGPHCLEGWPETELAQGLEPRPEEFLIRKRRYSAFFGTELEIVLKAYKAETVILIGGLTDVCIHYTAVDAHQHDYRVRVVTDAVGGSTQEAHDAALRAIDYLQRDALVTADEVQAWLADAPANPEVARAELAAAQAI
jgi:nicotinamidase-related amidase